MLSSRWRHAFIATFLLLTLIATFEFRTSRIHTFISNQKILSWPKSITHTSSIEWQTVIKKELVSLTTHDGEALPIYFAESDNSTLYNPNVLPHPSKPGTWIVVVRKFRAGDDPHREWYCEASLYGGALVCDTLHRELEVTTRLEGNCTGSDERINRQPRNRGPRDARVFYGPKGPYIIFGAFAIHNCQGIWLQDARAVLDSFNTTKGTISQEPFSEVVEVQRPPPYGPREKNFFVFWDSSNQIYAHHDIWPQRTFAALNADGTVSDNLGALSAEVDDRCMAKYMPSIESGREEFHQATNSLSVTLCYRTDPTCRPDDSNTFIMHIFHHNSMRYHIYDPYVILFQRTAPFALHGISSKPLSVRGRMQPHLAEVRTIQPSDLVGLQKDFFYTTSMNWKDAGQMYHGYLDDVLFLSFGVKDERAVVMDVKAEDLLRDLAYC